MNAFKSALLVIPTFVFLTSPFTTKSMKGIPRQPYRVGTFGWESIFKKPKSNSDSISEAISLNIGVNWSEAEFTETRIYTSPVSFTVLRKDGYGNIFGMENGETKDFPIIFKSGDKSYWIKLDNCYYSNGKWFSGNPNAGGLLDDD